MLSTRHVSQWDCVTAYTVLMFLGYIRDFKAIYCTQYVYVCTYMYVRTYVCTYVHRADRLYRARAGQTWTCSGAYIHICTVYVALAALHCKANVKFCFLNSDILLLHFGTISSNHRPRIFFWFKLPNKPVHNIAICIGKIENTKCSQIYT